jgi:hypothetical protein
MRKPTPPKLEVIEGSRHDLEHELVKTLFTEFGSEANKKVDRLIQRLTSKGKLSVVKGSK